MIDMPGQCINIYVVFTLDRRANMFRLRIPRLSVPEDSAEFSVNASPYRHWDNSIRAYIDDCIKAPTGHSTATITCNGPRRSSRTPTVFWRGAAYFSTPETSDTVMPTAGSD
jgi:hypothetical protein